MFNNNYLIRTIYSNTLSSLTLSFYKTNLALAFSPLNLPHFKKCCKTTLSTTISDENAATLWELCQSIITGKQTTSMKYIIECNNQTTLTFECDLNKERQMQAILTIEKYQQTTPFIFDINPCKIYEKGELHIKYIQTGLIVFTKALEAYLTGIAAERPEYNKNNDYY